MPVAKVAAGMRKHVNQIFRVWGGKECTHVQIVETVDDQGNIIDRSETESTIYGIVSPAGFDEKQQPIGSLQSGDLTAYFLTDDDVIVSSQLTSTTSRRDNIVYESVEYRVNQLQDTAFDVLTSRVSHEAVFSRYNLRKVAP